jgi:holo-[acyl-carrier protein] synthase
MVLGIGVDIIEVARVQKAVERNPRFVDKVFTATELAYSEGKKTKFQHLAARFAAKEAFGKALGTGLAGIRLKDIQVINNHNGRPEIRLYDTALARLDAMKGRSIHISLTHESDNAIAMVVIEG